MDVLLWWRDVLTVSTPDRGMRILHGLYSHTTKYRGFGSGPGLGNAGPVYGETSKLVAMEDNRLENGCPPTRVLTALKNARSRIPYA